MTRREIACVGGVVRDGEGRLLLVRRLRPPEAGRWSVPGGKVEAGEGLEEAVVRELHEETGLRVAVVSYAGRVRRDAPDGGVFVIDDFVCRSLDPPGSARAASDAAEVGWFDEAQLRGLPLVTGLAEALAEWQV